LSCFKISSTRLITWAKIPLGIHQNMSFQAKNSFFPGDPCPDGRGTPSPHLTRRPQPNLWIRPCVPQSSIPIYTCFGEIQHSGGRYLEFSSKAITLKLSEILCQNFARRLIGRSIVFLVCST